MAGVSESRYKGRRKRGRKNQSARFLDSRSNHEMDLSMRLKNRLDPKYGNGNCQPTQNHSRNTYSSESRSDVRQMIQNTDRIIQPTFVKDNLRQGINYATESPATEVRNIRGRRGDKAFSARNESFRRSEISPQWNNKRKIVSYEDLQFSDDENDKHHKRGRSKDASKYFRTMEQPYRNETDKMEQMNFGFNKNFDPARETKIYERSKHHRKRSSQSSESDRFIPLSFNVYSERTKEGDLVAELVGFLHRNRNRVKLDDLENSREELFIAIKSFGNYNKIEHFVKKYKGIFSVTEANNKDEDVDSDTFVSHNFSLELCERFCQQTNLCDESCGKLHICRFFIMGSCEINHEHCNHGHMFSSEHNYVVLNANYSHRIDDEDIKDCLLSRRTALTLPRICTFYNAKGCDKESKCQFLHVCKHYIVGKCKHTSTCKRSHEFSDNQPFDVLCKFRLQDYVTRPGKEQNLLTMLKAMVIEEEAKYADKKRGFAVHGMLSNFGIDDNVEQRYRGLPKTPPIHDFQWTMHSSNSNFEGSLETEVQRKLEQHYQYYLQSKKCILQVNEEEVEVNFERMNGSCLTKNGRCIIHFDRESTERYFEPWSDESDSLKCRIKWGQQFPR